MCIHKYRVIYSNLNNDEEEEIDSDSENVLTMRHMNISKNIQSNRNKPKQDSNRKEKSLATQRMSSLRKRQKGKDTLNDRQEESTSDEEPQPSTSQASQERKKKGNTFQSQKAYKSLSQASTSGAHETLYGEASQTMLDTSLTEQEYNHHVANVVKYILAADHSNNPIERSNISKAVNCYNKKFKDIFKSAQDALEDVFGYQLEELIEENKNGIGNQVKQAKSTNLKYILVNKVSCEDKVIKNLCDDGDEETIIHYVLLFLCLTHIFMSGDKCTEESLRTFLKKLEILTDSHTRHEQFGDAMDVIKKIYTKEKYINYNEKEDEFSWGIRALKELKPRTVMNFVSEIYGGRDIKTWPQEYERLLAKEQEQNQRLNGQVNGAKH
ncbi:non-structural maintenance of chromosomes element 3 homolog isoform X2 [Phymastichus coffea]|uniref:non-structural maintenance of chromosomes element 3 homolog isoform X2 n=1 Tax=Phymastichus coffea TaxID=108790 RepID=UPI00273B47FB|nr:non-structural maintenance of chromosomes element 3 homolog isoform X2 [Phymastichus coffea]